LPNEGGLVSQALPVETHERASLRFAPSGGYHAAAQNEFVVGSDSVPAGLARYPTYLQGDTHRDLTPKPLTLHLSFARPGGVSVRVGQISKSGAHLKVLVDGKPYEQDYPSGEKDHEPSGASALIRADVDAGAHIVTIENTGRDWLTLRDIALAGYAPALAADGRVGKDFAVAWIYHRDNISVPPGEEKDQASGTLALIGLKPGDYRVTWWNTESGSSISSAALTVGKLKTSATISIPSVTRDIAVYVGRANKQPTAVASAGARSRPGAASEGTGAPPVRN